ncbi:MFS transporter [Schumannella luteola]|uniref:MFS family permease n=1 Tax=Schumannella luteola TaxID=472059 RepID=A0A852Y4R5_9MICO|nr:MFS family permease [Schumannella luteola]
MSEPDENSTASASEQPQNQPASTAAGAGQTAPRNDRAAEPAAPQAAPGTEQAAKKRRFVDLSPLKASPAFARIWIGGAISGIGAQLTIVAVGLLIYDITPGSAEAKTFAVSLVGIISLAPMIVAGLWGGMLADAFDRRLVLIVSALAGWLSTLALIVIAVVDAVAVDHDRTVAVWPLYVITTVNAVAATISGTTRMAVTPRILPDDMVARAAALNGISIGVMVMVGPAVAGILVAAVGFPWTFAVDAVLFLAGFAGILTLPKLPPLGKVERPGFASLVEGVRFLRTAPNIRLSFLVDIVAMTFGRPHTVFPAVGAVLIGGGPITVGVLTAGMAVGAFLASVFSGPVAHIHHHGRAVGRAITVYGAFVAGFGLVLAAMATGWFGKVGPGLDQVNWIALVLATLALVGMGVSDEFSAIFRSTMMLMASPDSMRGRLQGVFTVVVTGGPRVGDLYVGVFATAVALWFPPLLGGLIIIGLIAVLLRLQPSFRAYDARQPTP